MNHLNIKKKFTNRKQYIQIIRFSLQIKNSYNHLINLHMNLIFIYFFKDMQNIFIWKKYIVVICKNVW